MRACVPGNCRAFFRLKTALCGQFHDHILCNSLKQKALLRSDPGWSRPQAAFCATLHDTELRAYYDRKRAVGKEHKVAISHVMRIQLRRLVAVLKTEKPYEVCYPGKADVPTEKT